jgi:hypothetical protein
VTARSAPCQLGPIDWGIVNRKQTVTLTARSGTTCSVNLVANSRVAAGRAGVWVRPSNGNAQVNAPTLIYTPTPGFSGDDMVGVVIETVDGGTKRSHMLEIKIRVQ